MYGCMQEVDAGQSSVDPDPVFVQRPRSVSCMQLIQYNVVMAYGDHDSNALFIIHN